MSEIIEQVLNLPEISVDEVKISEKKIELKVSSVLCEKRCPKCGKPVDKVHQLYHRRVRDLSITGREVYLLLEVRQFLCTDCGRHFAEKFNFVRPHSTMTIRFEKYICDSCRQADISYVSAKENLCWNTVQKIFSRFAAQQRDREKVFSKVRRPGIDEISLKKGHKDYVAVLVNLDTGEILDILQDRSKAFLKAYFTEKGSGFCRQITLFCSDMWEGYLNCAKEVFPDAVIAADRFHFFSVLQDAVDKTRKAFRKKYPDCALLKKIKYLLLRNPEDLTGEQRSQLHKVFSDPRYRDLKLIYQAKVEFRNVLEKEITKAQAQMLITEWLEKFAHITNRFYKDFVKFYRTWSDYILNYFTGRYTTSIIEGINNKLKSIKRRAFGFLNFENFKDRAFVEFS